MSGVLEFCCFFAFFRKKVGPAESDETHGIISDQLDIKDPDSITYSSKISVLVKYFLSFCCTIIPFFLLTQAQTRQIAITIDDAPMGQGAYFTGERRGQMMIQRLKQAGVEQAIFFVITDNIDEEGSTRLTNYVNAGHRLANHSHTHGSANRVPWKQYVADIQTADSVMKTLSGVVPFYRYPYLHEGKDTTSRDSIRQAILDLRMANGYVTVDTYDWYIHALVRDAKRADKKINTSALKAFWVDHMYQCIEFYDSVAVANLGRSPKHVLLLHENDLTGLFIYDLVQKLNMEGWEIIPATSAYSDAIAQVVPKTLFLGQGRVAAIAADKGSEPKDLVPYWEDEEYLKAEAERRKIFTNRE